MKNPFVAARVKAIALSQLARKAAMMCFNLGLTPRDAPVSEVTGCGHNKYSKHTVAQDKRAAIKRRNRSRK
jgi:hypothetical protein